MADKWFGDVNPILGERVFIAPGAIVIGNVVMEADSSVLFGAVLRADTNIIKLGKRSNVQDNSVIHVNNENSCTIGDDVLIGHKAMVHGCTIEDAVLIGINSVILDGAVIGTGSIVGAGAVVTPGTIIPPLSLVLGVPGKVVKTLPEENIEYVKSQTAHYVWIKNNYISGNFKYAATNVEDILVD